MKEKFKKIIEYAPERMREMLRSVAYYNSGLNDDLLGRILFAMSIIDRKFFVNDEEYAYHDTALPLEKGQTISQPSTIAAMLLHVGLKEGDDVLEIGTGSGWNAALIMFLVYPGNVSSIDRINALTERAKENIGKLEDHLKQTSPQDVTKLKRLNFLTENIFSKEKTWKKRYDKIIITAGISDRKTEEKIEEVAKNLLKQNSLLICPYVSGPLIIYRKKEKGKLEIRETEEQYVFVPLLGGVEK